MMSQNRLGCVIAAMVLALMISMVINAGFLVTFAMRSATTRSDAPNSVGPYTETEVLKAEDETEGKKEKKKVVLISLRGVISGAQPGKVGESEVDDLLLQLSQAQKDPLVSAVILRVDSPGGEVTASDVLYEAVLRLKGVKPVVVIMESVAASGGYYVACAGTHIFAHATTITGSIGVIMQTVNYRELLGKVGLEVMTFKSGAMKDLLNGARQLTEEEKKYVQGMIDQSYGRFVGIVAKSRGIEESVLRNGIADGRILSGMTAHKERLIDEIGGLDEAIQKARDLGKTPHAAVVRYDVGASLGKILRLLGEATPQKQTKVDVDVAGSRAMQKLQNGRLYYMSPLMTE